MEYISDIIEFLPWILFLLLKFIAIIAKLPFWFYQKIKDKKERFIFLYEFLPIGIKKYQLREYLYNKNIPTYKYCDEAKVLVKIYSLIISIFVFVNVLNLLIGIIFKYLFKSSFLILYLKTTMFSGIYIKFFIQKSL